MNIISKVISTFVNNTILSIKCYVLGRSVRTPVQVAPFGIDSNPVAGMQAIYSTTSNTDNAGIILGYINVNSITNTGETRLFSTDANGNFKFNIKLANDGNLYMGNVIDFTAYNDFLLKYNEFKHWHDTYYLLHTHATGTGESSMPTIQPIVDDSFKTQNIKVQ